MWIGRSCVKCWRSMRLKERWSVYHGNKWKMGYRTTHGKKEKGMKKRQVTRPEPATFRSTADPLAAEPRLQSLLSTIVWACSIQSAMLLTVSPCTPSPRREHCCAVCEFCTGVHCTDDSPSRLKQPLSADVVFAVLHTCTYTLTLSADVVSAVSSHAHGMCHTQCWCGVCSSLHMHMACVTLHHLICCAWYCVEWPLRCGLCLRQYLSRHLVI